jgi:hypothetical protein
VTLTPGSTTHEMVPVVGGAMSIGLAIQRNSSASFLSAGDSSLTEALNEKLRDQTPFPVGYNPRFDLRRDLAVRYLAERRISVQRSLGCSLPATKRLQSRLPTLVPPSTAAPARSSLFRDYPFKNRLRNVIQRTSDWRLPWAP